MLTTKALIWLEFQVAHLQEIPNPTPEDDEAIEALLDAMKGGAEVERQRGTLLSYITALSQPKEQPSHGIW
jgi:hypothetical protein